MREQFYVYIMANKKRGVIYIGFSGDLIGRVWQHKNKVDPNSFTARYNLKKLVYYEIYGDPATALQREKQLKKWKRQWKIELIEQDNPNWNDLYDDL